jgi:leucine-rich repeat protein SHOC2
LLQLSVWGNELTSLPAEIGQLTNLIHFDGGWNISAGLLTSSDWLRLSVFENALSSLPAEIGQLTSLTRLYGGRDIVLDFSFLSLSLSLSLFV